MAWRFVARHFMPFPEIVEPEPHEAPYEIIDSRDKSWLPTNGMVSKVRRQLFVPLAPVGGPVTLHELAHVRWSPQELPPVPFDARILLAVEDARINLGLERKDLPVRLCAGDRGQVAHLAAEDLERGDTGTLVLRAIASIGTNALVSVLAPAADASAEALDLASRLVRRVRSGLQRARRRAGGPVAPFEAALRLAGVVARELDALGLMDEGNAARPVSMPGAGCCLVKESAAMHDIRRIIAERSGPLSRGRGDVRLGGGGDRSGGGGGAGRMEIAEAPLDVACPRVRGGARTWRPAAEGSVIRYLNRWCIDQAIFRRPARRRGGSVLVDTSGSMSLDEAGVDRILRDAPSATLVAIYSGSGRKGQLRIVARRGRRASPEHLKPFGGANVVDVPALAWLARQPAPRVWISDGHVTGVGDASSPAIKRRCTEICGRAAIRRVRKVEDAARLLEGRTRVPRLPPVPR
ncbi:MAG: hypothetical protein ACYSWT_00635 [Planctomycetota bacterium]|jgi:hypothetical protein